MSPCSTFHIDWSFVLRRIRSRAHDFGGLSYSIQQTESRPVDKFCVYLYTYLCTAYSVSSSVCNVPDLRLMAGCESQVPFQGSLSSISGGQSDTGTGSYPSTVITLSCIIRSTMGSLQHAVPHASASPHHENSRSSTAV